MLESVKRIILFLMFTVLLVNLPGCSGQAAFKLLDEKHLLRKGTLAVISGSHRDGDVFLASRVTELLAGSDRFRVMTQQDISQRLSEYPSVIDLQNSSRISDSDENASWFSPSGKLSLDAMQAKLGVDYILVLWIAKITHKGPGLLSNSDPIDVYPVGNLLEYPGGRVVGSLRLHKTEEIALTPFYGISLLQNKFKKEGDRIEILIDVTALEIVESLNDMSTNSR